MEDTDSISGSGRSPGEGNGYSSIPIRKISWIEEPGELHGLWGLRVGHDWANNTQTLHIRECFKFISFHDKYKIVSELWIKSEDHKTNQVNINWLELFIKYEPLIPLFSLLLQAISVGKNNYLRRNFIFHGFKNNIDKIRKPNTKIISNAMYQL